MARTSVPKWSGGAADSEWRVWVTVNPVWIGLMIHIQPCMNVMHLPALSSKENQVSKIVITHEVKDIEAWTSKPSMDALQGAFAPYATDIVAYTAVDGSNRIAVSANIHDMVGMRAFSSTAEAAANMKKSGVVVDTLIWHIEGSPAT